MNYTLTTFW